MDIAKATKAAAKLTASGSNLTGVAWFSAKASWITQISGAYNLLFPNIHIDFPTREEIMKYVSQKITFALIKHNATHWHNGLESYPFPDDPDTETPILNSKGEKLFTKYGEKIYTRRDPKFTKIGYGV